MECQICDYNLAQLVAVSPRGMFEMPVCYSCGEKLSDEFELLEADVSAWDYAG